jgi:integrase
LGGGDIGTLGIAKSQDDSATNCATPMDGHHELRVWDVVHAYAVLKLAHSPARSSPKVHGASHLPRSSGERLPGTTVGEWCIQWLAIKKVETEVSTHQRYGAIVKRFVEGLGVRSKSDLSAVRSEDIASLRDRLASELSRSSAIMAVKVFRVCLGAALKRGLVTSNPAATVDTLKRRGESKRRPFTLPEIQRLLVVCNDEWRGLVLFGIYTGQRLGDLARLTCVPLICKTGRWHSRPRRQGAA